MIIIAAAAAARDALQVTRVVPDFSSGKSRIRPFFITPAKICQLLQHVQLITDAAHLSNGVFAILISVTWMIKIQKPLLFRKFRQKLANSDAAKEAVNYTASLQQLTHC